MVVSEASVISFAAEQYRGLVDKYATEGRLNVDLPQAARVRRVAGPIIVQAKLLRAETAKWNWEINVVHDRSANAWCMAGGKMMIYSGIIERLHLTDSELAAIVAHETAHAVAQHQREMMSERVINDVTDRRGNPLVGVMLPDTTDPHSSVVTSVFMLPYSREKEAEADRIGLTLMARAGFDPQAMLMLFQKLDAYDKSNTSDFLSNHPSNQRRVTAIRDAIANDPELSDMASPMSRVDRTGSHE